MFDLTIKSFRMCFQRFQSTAPRDDSLSGEVGEIGTLAVLTGQFGRGFTALLDEVKLLIFFLITSPMNLADRSFLKQFKTLLIQLSLAISR
jgi:hypothetical protein